MLGTTLSHYRILHRVAAGGMGVVYCARDERLEREVALKVLPEGALADAPARARFRNEALALSRLNHPAIATIFDFDSEGGTDFLVMEYVQGITLAEKLAGGALPEPELIDLGIQIADALEAAHEQGVVHRDLKPGNVVVTPRGRVKVLDFGLAKLLQPGGTPAATLSVGGPGMAGTLGYMAPEQFLGTRVDARADLFALGVVLYEMATGRHPHADQPPAAMMYAIVNTRPAPPRRERPGLSPRLEAAILKALEKQAERRHQTAKLLADELRSITASPGAPRDPAPTARIESIAVLPLVNLSGDPEQEFFTDGMTEALIASLAQIRALRVISRTSAMQYKGAKQPLPEIARALNVDAIVEGGVLRSGERVRVTANLIEAATDRHLWSKSYERDVGDVLALQGTIARAIADEVRIEITPREQRRLATGRAVDPAAYEPYLKGRYCWNRRTVPELRRGIEFFQQAIEADPTYAEAYAGLADSYNILADMSAMRPSEGFAIARAAAERALEIDDQLAEAHTSMGFLRTFHEWNWSGAEESYRRALAINPGYATAHQWHAEFLVTQARFDEALTEARRAHTLDPLAFILGTTVGDVLFFSRRYDEAIAQLRATVEMEPRFLPAHNDLGRALAQRGDYDESIAEFQTASRLAGSDPKASAGLAHVLALAGRHDEARAILADMEARAATGLVSINAIAVIHVALGELEGGITWIERAFQERDRALVWAKVHPRLDPLRSDPRFQAVLARMGLAG
jgi:serine/threonine-protein kinase